MALVGDPGWRVIPDGGRLVVTAGADAVWYVEDVPASVADLVARYWSDEPPADVPTHAQPVVEHLAGLGALRPAALTPTSSGVRVEVVGSGAGLDGFDVGPAGAGLVVVVRTNAPLRSLLSVAQRLHAAGVAHVLVDVAFHHTVVLGPHVVPGDTACMGCLVGRVGVRWGDPEPPSVPLAVGDVGLAAALAKRWIQSLAEGSAALVNATVAFDLPSLTTRREPLWRLPACEVCTPWSAGGAIELPWQEAAS